MKPRNTIALFSCLLSLLSGCTSKEGEAVMDRQEIKFNYFLQEGDKVTPLNEQFNGHSRAASDNILTAGFELYGVWNNQDMPTAYNKANSSTENGIFFFDKQQINWNAISETYDYTGDRRYWIADGKIRHSFAARSIDPVVAVDGNNKGGSTNKGFTTNRWIPSVSYYVHPDPKEQHDLLVATGPMNIVVQNATPTVNLYFKHALSKIRVMLLSSAGATLYIGELKIKYVGVLFYSGALTFTAEEESPPSGDRIINKSYTLKENFVVPPSASDERSAFTAGEFLVLPQTPDNSWIELSMSYSLADGAEKQEAKMGIPAGVSFKPGMQYTYYIRVTDQPQELTITNLQIEPWVTEYKMVDPL